MSDRERDKDRRKKRTSLNQYLMYLLELEEDDIFRSGTIPKDVEFDYISKKWEKLTEKLNTCDNGPSMTPEEWKKVKQSTNPLLKFNDLQQLFFFHFSALMIGKIRPGASSVVVRTERKEYQSLLWRRKR